MNPLRSLPVRGAWVEIYRALGFENEVESLPVRGAWVEIMRSARPRGSHFGRSPCGERGLKSPAAW